MHNPVHGITDFGVKGRIIACIHGKSRNMCSLCSAENYGETPDEVPTIIFRRVHADAIAPSRGTPKSAGFDLYAVEDMELTGGQGNYLVNTGISVILPPGTYGRIAARSGLSVKEHFCVSAGVIDPDYTGSIGVVLFITKNAHTYQIKKGDRIAQLVVEKVAVCDVDVWEYDPVVTIENTHAGYGSTGK